MINLIKYSPLSIRELKQPCTLAGPTFSRAKTVEFKAAGATISLKCPKHNHLAPHATAPVSPLGKIDQVFDRGGLQRYYKTVMPNQAWAWGEYLSRSWAYYGPWFTGCRAVASISVSVIGRSEENNLENVSFLHPKAFEGALASYLTALYGNDRTGNGRATHKGPVNWELYNGLPVCAATFDLFRVGVGGRLHSPVKMLCFPISDEYFVKAEFEVRKRARTAAQLELIDTAPVNNLVTQIIESFSVKLGEPGHKKVEELKREQPKSTLTEQFPPLDWSSTSAAKNADI